MRRPFLSLKSVDGEIEASVRAGLEVTLPEAQAGISTLSLVGRITAQTPTETACGDSWAAANFTTTFAGISSFGRDPAATTEISFDTLSALTDGAGTRPTVADRTQDIGWRDAFGLPFLDVVQYASAGVLTRENGETELASQIWLDVTLGDAPVDVLGEITVEDDGSDTEITEWSLSSQGPVAMGDLPGLMGIEPLEKLWLSDLSITPGVVEGTVLLEDSGAQATTDASAETQTPLAETQARARVTFGEAPEGGDIPVTAFMRIEDYTPGRTIDFLAGMAAFPPEIGNISYAPLIVGLNTGPAFEENGQDAPWLFAGYLESGETLLVEEGMTLAAGANPKDFVPPDFEALIDEVLELPTDASIYATYTLDEPTTGALTASFNGLEISANAGSLLNETLSFQNAQLSLVRETADETTFSIATDAQVKVPSSLSRDEIVMDMSGDITVASEGAGAEQSKSLAMALSMDTSEGLRADGALFSVWSTPFDIPELAMDAVGFEAAVTQSATEKEESYAFVGAGRFKSYPGEITIDLAADMTDPAELVATFETTEADGVPLSAILPPQINALRPDANIALRRISVARNAVAADMTVSVGAFELSGKGAVLQDGSDAAFFIRAGDAQNLISPVDVLPADERALLGPVAELAIPGGIFVLATKDLEALGLDGMPQTIFDELAEDFTDDKAQTARLLRSEGISFLTRMQVEDLPRATKAVVDDVLGISGSAVVAGSAGGIFGDGAEPSFGFAVGLENFTPPLPDLPAGFLTFDKSSTQAFFEAKRGTTPGFEVGVSIDATVTPRRLDTLEEQPDLKGTFSLTYAQAQGADTQVALGIEINGTWENPLGIEGYRFTDPSIKVGNATEGVLLEVATKRATLTDGNGADFAMDLSSTWAGAVPTSLAAQFGRVVPEAPEGATGVPVIVAGDLDLRPTDLMRAYHSFFELAFRSGAASSEAAQQGLTSLGDTVLARLEREAQLTLPSELAEISSDLTAGNLRRLFDTAGRGNDGVMTLLENSPMAMVGVRNPTFYFGTPGATPPRNADLAPNIRPPLGFGLHVAGTFFVDVAGVTSAEIADGAYRVDLRGYHFDGSFALPAPLEQNKVSASGTMPMLIPGAPGLTLAASVGLPQSIDVLRVFEDLPLPVRPRAEMSGTLTVSGPQLDAQRARVAGSLSLFGLASPTIDVTLDRGNLPIALPAGCALPFSINTTVDVNNISNTLNALPSLIRPDIPNPVDCLGDLAEKLAELGTEAAETAVQVISDPAAAAAAGFDTATEIAERGAEVATDPRAAVDLGISLARKPVDAVQGVSNAAFGFTRTAVGGVPVIGPSVAEALGEMQNAANFLASGAQNAVFNNEVSGFISQGLSSVGSGVIDAVGGVGSTIGGWFSSGGSQPWYIVSPARCDYRRHHWHELFKQCFENGAVVIQDNTLRQQVVANGGSLGPCIAAALNDGHHVGVSQCAGNATNQIHFEPLTRRIRMATSSYNGYSGGYTEYPEYCLTAEGSSTERRVLLRECGTATGTQNQTWRFNANGKLESGGLCARNENGRLWMRDCESANDWLASSVSPDRHQTSGVAPFGRIRNSSSGSAPADPSTWLCPYWQPVSGPFTMADCSRSAGEDDWVARNSVSIVPLGQNNRVKIFAPRPYDREVIFPCMGANQQTKTFLVQHCHPHVDAPSTHWRVERLDPSNGYKVDPASSQNSVAWMLQGTYRLRNESVNRCLGWGLNAAGVMRLNLMICADGDGLPEPRIQWTGYLPDNKGVSAAAAAGYAARFAAQAQAAQIALAEGRETLYPKLLEWQRERTRAENARAAVMKRRADHEPFRNLYRTGPAQCAPGTTWVSPQGCLDRSLYDDRFQLRVISNRSDPLCLTARYWPRREGASLASCRKKTLSRDWHDATHFDFDEFGRIRETLNRQDIRAITGPDGVTRNQERPIFLAHRCLQPTRPSREFQGHQIVEFETCSAPQPDASGVVQVDAAEIWRIAGDGTFVSSDNRCLRLTEGYSGGSFLVLLTLQDCTTDPRETYSAFVRFTRQTHVDLQVMQGLPDTARLKFGGTHCLQTDLVSSSAARLSECSGDASEHFAFGAVSANAFLLSPRDSKLCLTASGDQLVRQETCLRGANQQFVRLDGGRIANVATGLCLRAIDDGRVGLLDCGADALTGLELEDTTANSPAFAMLEDLQLPPTPGIAMQRTRASFFYAGAYIEEPGGLTLHKTAEHEAIFGTPGRFRISDFPRDSIPELSNWRDDLYDMADEVPFTDLMFLPGFEDGSDHITIAHVLPVRFSDGRVRNSTIHPVAAHMMDWVRNIHLQRVFRIRPDGSAGFDLIEETDSFRKSATFRMVPSPEGQADTWLLQSVLNPTLYMSANGGDLAFGPQGFAARLKITSTSKWLGTDALNRPRIHPMLQETWQYPEDPSCSFLRVDLRTTCFR
ncbi:hypothetical protein ACS3SW_16865 [Roseobacteraceae bacterium S113]